MAEAVGDGFATGSGSGPGAAAPPMNIMPALKSGGVGARPGVWPGSDSSAANTRQ